MKRMACTVGAMLAMAGAVRAQDLAGDWQGAMQGADRRVVLLISGDGKGPLSATLFSIDQSSHGIPGSVSAISDHDVQMDFGKAGGRYDAVLSADGATLSGRWTNGGRALQLDLHRTSPDRLWVRCVEPQRTECHRLPGDTHPTGE